MAAGCGMQSASRGWVLTLDRVLFGCGAFVIATQLVGVAGAASASHSGARLFVAIVAIVDLGLIGLCAHGFRFGRRPGAAMLASLTAGVGVCSAVVAAADGGVPAFALQLLPTNAVQALQIVAIAFVVRPVVACLVILATGPAFVAIQMGIAGVPAFEALDGWVLPATSSVAIVVAFAALRRSAHRADSLAKEARASAASAAAAASRAAAEDEVRRLVHDDVVTALRAVELGLPQPAVNRSAVAAIIRLDETYVVEDADADADAVRAAGWIARVVGSAAVRVDVHDSGWPVTPPPRVIDAVSAAAAEALRNVERHAGVDQAELVVQGDGPRCVIEVRDRGRGFRPDAGPGFGISESIVNRMRGVGGIAQVDADDEGTAVRLTWPAMVPNAAAEPDRRSPIEFDRQRTYLLLVAGPIVANLYLAVRFPGTSLIAGLAIALAASLLLVVSALLVGRRPARAGETLAVGAIACLLVWAGLAVAPDGALLSVESWIVGFAAVGLAVVAFESKPLLAALTCAAEVGIVVAFAVRDPAIEAFAPVGAIVTPVVVVGLGIATGVGLRRGHRAIRRTEAVLVGHAEDEAWRAGEMEARQTHLAHLRSEVVPFLREVIDGDQADAPATARRLGDLCRDDLNLGRPIPMATRERVRGARERGVRVTVRATEGRRVVPTAIWSTLEAVLDAATPGHVVTVVPPRRAGEPGRVVAVPPLQRPLPDATTDGYRTTVLVASSETSTV